VAGCELPEDRLYDLEDSTWVTRDPNSGLWTLGVMASLLAFAGRVQSFTFRPDDSDLAQGRSVATIESVRFTGPIRLPVDGTVVERNRELLDRPRLLHDSPYDRGWVVRFRPRAPEPLPAHLESAAAIADRLARRIAELRIRCFPALPDFELIEVGTECSATLARLDEELAPRAPGAVVLLVTDDPTSPIELVRWSDGTGHRLLAHRQEGNLHQFLIRKEAGATPRRRSPGTGTVAGAGPL